MLVSTQLDNNPVFFPVGALITHKPSSIIAEEGQIAILRCKASGRPTPKITWRRALSHLPKGKTRVVDGNLTIVGVAKSDSGAYECLATNLLRQETAIAVLMVADRLKFTISPPLKVTANRSSDLMLNCKAQGSTGIIWERAGKSLPQNHVLYFNGTLLLRNLKGNDAGSYKCIARNSQRSIEAVSFVKVRGEYLTILEPSFLVVERKGKNRRTKASLV